MTQSSRSDSSVTWRWVAIGAITLASLAGGSWLNYLQGQVTDVRVAANATAEKVNSQATQQAVTQQKVETVDRKVEAIQRDISDVKSTLQQILINQERQQQNQRQAPH